MIPSSQFVNPNDPTFTACIEDSKSFTHVICKSLQRVSNRVFGPRTLDHLNLGTIPVEKLCPRVLSYSFICLNLHLSAEDVPPSGDELLSRRVQKIYKSRH